MNKIVQSLLFAHLMSLGLFACGGTVSPASGPEATEETTAALAWPQLDGGCTLEAPCPFGQEWDVGLCACRRPGDAGAASCGSTTCSLGETCCDFPGPQGVCEPRCTVGHVCPEVACRPPLRDAGCVGLACGGGY